jgi:hypothetical protein
MVCGFPGEAVPDPTLALYEAEPPAPADTVSALQLFSTPESTFTVAKAEAVDPLV